MSDSVDVADVRAGSASTFAHEADQAAPGFVREVWDFLRFNKKWWLAPILIALVVIGGILILGATGAAPFIYTLF